MKKYETTCSVANKKRNRKRIVLTEETLDERGASLERTPTKFIPKLAQQVGISECSAHRATKLLKVKPSSIFYTVRQDKVRFFTCFTRVVYVGGKATVAHPIAHRRNAVRPLGFK